MSTPLIWAGVIALFGMIGVVVFIVTPGYPPVESHTQLTEDIVKTMTEGSVTENK